MEKKNEDYFTLYDGDDRQECLNDTPEIFYDYYFNERRRYDRENIEYNILDDYFEILNINYYNKNTINNINKLQ